MPSANETPLLPQDYIMDIQNHERFSDSNYPKLKKLYQAKHELIEKRRHP